MSDILVKLTDEDLAELGILYSQHRTDAEHIYTFIQNALQWRKQMPKKVWLDFYVVAGDDWRTDGTFVSYAQFQWRMIITYTLHDANRLYEVFNKTTRFDYTRETIFFYALHENHIPVVSKALSDRGVNIESRDDTDLWRCPNHLALSMEVNYPEEFELAPLEVIDSGTINSVWPHRGDESEEYIKILLTLNGGYGLYTRDTPRKLCAWILKTQIGQLGLLQVVDAYKRRGLAQALIGRLSKDIAAQGDDVLATIVTDNAASQALFTKCGFAKRFLVAFMVFK